MTRIKICGLRRQEDALVAVDAGADMIGFVFAPSRRRIEPEFAAEIIAAVRRQASFHAVGIFVNETAVEVNRIAKLTDLDYVQLSGDEPEKVLSAVVQPVIKTLHISSADDQETIKRRAVAGSASILHLDTGHAGSYGGTGIPFNWVVLPAFEQAILLAGGLHAGNVQHAIRQVRPWGVDVSSGVETDGVKDIAKIREFIRCARKVTAQETAPA